MRGKPPGLGGADPYRVRMVNALLGVVQAEAVMADTVTLDGDARHVAWQEQFTAAGAGLDDPVRRMEFLRWQVLRASTPPRLMAQNQGAGPIRWLLRTRRPGCTCCSA